MTIRVRAAEPRDAAKVARLIDQLRVLEGIAEPLEPAIVDAYLADPTARVLVAELDGAVAGVLALRTMRDLFHGGLYALVEELVIDERHRRQGVGGALLDEAIAIATEERCAEISLSTGSSNAAAKGLYSSRGFEECGIYMERHFG